MDKTEVVKPEKRYALIGRTFTALLKALNQSGLTRDEMKLVAHALSDVTDLE